MVQDFFDRHIFLYIMGGLCGLGVILKCFLLIIYNKLISSSENMAHTKRNWLKTMKLRFESSYQLQLGVNDVDTYVDKYVSKLKCGGLLLSTWENISGQTIGLCLLTGSFAGIIGFIYKCGQGQVLFTFFTGAWTAIIVNIVDNIVNISAHRQMLRYNLIDYFENNLKARMEQEVFHPEARRKYQREYFTEDAKKALYAEDTEFIQSKLKPGKVTAATVELQGDLEGDEVVHNQNDRPVSKDISRKDRRQQKKQAKKQAKLDKKQARKEAKIAKKEAKRAKKQEKYDAMEAKKKEKADAIEAKKKKKIELVETKKQAKNASKEAKKQLKQHSKQEVIDDKKLKRQRREESREAKERAEIETIKSKKQAREEAKEKRTQIEKERKEKELHGNKAYREKMRLKEEKEREAAKREEEIKKVKDSSKKENVDFIKSNEKSHNEINESLTKQKLRGAIRDISKEKVQVTRLDDLADEDLMEPQGEEEKESLELTATSKEEDMLIEEVLKDFLF